MFYSGAEISCHDLDIKVFVEEGIAADSPQCKTSQDSYSGFCCTQAPEDPCDMCRMNGVSFEMITDMKISYEGKVQTCLEVHNTLYSRREQSSEHCISAQGNFFDQCCEEVGILQPQSDRSSGSSASQSPTTAVTSPKPTLGFESWYAGALKSDSVNSRESMGSYFSAIAVGLFLLV